MDNGQSTVSLLAAAVAARDEVDWDLAERSAADPAERRLIQQLRQLATLNKVSLAQTERWGSLELRGEIGRGTFGTVYRAWDPRLEIDVALKLSNVPVEPAGAPSSAIKEGQLLAQVRHPNVVSVYGADSIDGRVGVWMELVTGRTLKEIVREQGPFGAHEAAVIGRDVARALAAVHHKGFLHRDIKAQNVMREAGGRTVLMDFGAGVAQQPADAEVPSLGGTPLYLAPEVLAGQRPTVQSDLYSLGVLLFHLVSGEFPVSGATLADVKANHVAGTRTLLRDVRPNLPTQFVRAVDAAISPDPASRPRSAGAMEALLERALVEAGDVRPSIKWWALAASIVIVGATGWALRDRMLVRDPVAATHESVAILPFRNLTSPGSEDDYFAEGITDDLAAHLSSLQDLRVVAGASTRSYKAQAKSDTEIATELEVATVLSGSVRRLGDRVRIVSTLVDAKSGVQLWSESFDRDLKDVLTMQAEVARKIAVALKGELTLPDERLLGAGADRNAEAFNLYLRGRYYWGLRTEDGMNRAVKYFNDAVAVDPGYALAFAGLSDAYTALGIYGVISRIDANAQAGQAAERAIALDPNLAEAHASLGYVQKNRFEWVAAEASFKRAIQLKPNYSSAHHFYANLLTQLGRQAEALAEIKRAVALDPLSISANVTVAGTLLMARRYDDAIAQYQNVLRSDPGFVPAYRGMAAAYMYSGRFSQASEAHRRAAEMAPLAVEDQELKSDMGYLAGVSGRRLDALRIITELRERHDKAGEAVAGSIAAIYSGLGDVDQAFTWLERAYKGRDPEVGFLKVDPRWDALRADGRFNQILEGLGLK